LFSTPQLYCGLRCARTLLSHWAGGLYEGHSICLENTGTQKLNPVIWSLILLALVHLHKSMLDSEPKAQTSASLRYLCKTRF